MTPEAILWLPHTHVHTCAHMYVYTHLNIHSHNEDTPYGAASQVVETGE